MIPASFSYASPRSVTEATALLAEDPQGSRLMGGGTWLVPEMSHGQAAPRAVIDLARAGLEAIEPVASGLRVGAMATYTDILHSPAVAEWAPLLARVAAAVTGGWSIRNQGTLGGSVAAARPQSDLPAALVALDAVALVHGARGERRVPIGSLFAGAMRTTLAHDEVLAAVELPAVRVDGVGYVKLKRGAGSWPIVTAAAVVSLDGRNRADVRLVIGGASATPVVVDLAGVVSGARATAAELAEVARLGGNAIREPWADALAPGEYRAAVAGPVARRALEMALAIAARRT